MTSLAPFLPRPVEPPDDARFHALGAPRVWDGLLADDVDAARPDGVLTLAPKPPGGGLGAPDGSLGGLIPPACLALAQDGRHVLIDTVDGRLLVFEPCLCAFAEVPCLPSSRLAPVSPRAVLIAGERLYVSDAGGNPSVLVYTRVGLILRASWRPPAGAVPSPWQPGLMASVRGRLFVADAANGAIHRFAPTGEHEAVFTGFGALAALAADRDGRLWIVRQGTALAERLDGDGKPVETVTRPDALATHFGPVPARVLADGRLLLTGIPACGPDGASFAGDGTRLPAIPAALLAPAFTGSGRFVSRPLDSGIESCVWHRLVPRLELPAGTRIAFACLTADVPLSDETVLGLPEPAWSLQAEMDAGDDALVHAAPGRYLWLSIRLQGPGDATPRLSRLEVEFPRVSLARRLPAAFRQDPVSADLTDRLVAVMDRPLREVETRIDHHAALYDPWSAPSRRGADMLGFVAGWLGLTFEARWPELRKRCLLAAMGRLLPLIGTVEGLRQALIAWFGWEEHCDGGRGPVPDGCHPRCGLPPTPGAGALPVMVLEHWKLRRWLFLGTGRLGDAAVLWGAGILNKTELYRGARVGASRLDSVHDSLRDPFHVAAWRFSLFLPACWGRDASSRASLARFVERFRPAHAAADIVYVAPRMRIGVQASIGFDTVVGRYPQATTALGTMRLGRASVTPVPPRDAPTRLGVDSHLHAAGRSRPSARNDAKPGGPA